MIDRTAHRPVRLPDDAPPCLMVVVDTEEEFDWSRPLSRENVSVASVAAQGLAQDIFDRHGIRPIYVVDYPVAADPAAAAHLRPIADDGRCEIGAHLHPWVTPPHEETVTPRNSYPGNLPESLEQRKLETLTETIARNFGRRPRVYRAGRFGVGPATAGVLERCGYVIDLSVVPRTSFADDGGPDFTAFDAHPYWFGTGHRLLEIPVTCGFTGAFSRWAPALYPKLAGRLGMALHAPGVFARLRMMERIRLTPEGADFAALRRLTESLLGAGHRVFSFTYHSPSLAAGNTPYVRTEAELAAFLRTIEQYCAYFMNDVGGRAVTPPEIYDLVAEGAPHEVVAAGASAP